MHFDLSVSNSTRFNHLSYQAALPIANGGYVPILLEVDIESMLVTDLRTTMVLRDVKNMWHGWRSQKKMLGLGTPVREYVNGRTSE